MSLFVSTSEKKGQPVSYVALTAKNSDRTNSYVHGSIWKFVVLFEERTGCTYRWRFDQTETSSGGNGGEVLLGGGFQVFSRQGATSTLVPQCQGEPRSTTTDQSRQIGEPIAEGSGLKVGNGIYNIIILLQSS